MKLRLINASNYPGIVIADGIIESIGKAGRDVDREIDCTGALIWPGLIDSHVHFRTPGEEYKEDFISGSRAALAGGVTSVIDMPNNQPPILTLADWKNKQQRASLEGLVDIRCALGVTIDTIEEAIQAGQTVPAIKVFLAPSTGGLVLSDPAALERLFRETSALLMFHAEDANFFDSTASTHEQQRNRTGALHATKLIIALAERWQRLVYICHVTTAEEVQLIREAKQRGVKLFAEVTPHHLWFSEVDANKRGALLKVNPPLRTAADQIALWAGIRDHTIDVIASDHAPHTLAEKQSKHPPSGVPGLETMFPLLLTVVAQKKITLDDIQRCCLINPAKIFKLKKNITINQAVDLVIFKPDQPWTYQQSNMYTKVKWSPYHKEQLCGKVFGVLKNKEIMLG